MTTEAEILEKIKKSVLELEKADCEIWARRAIDAKIEPLKVANTLTEAIKEIGDSFGRGEIFLPELLMAAAATKGAQSIIEEELKKTGEKRQSVGILAIGTVAGDIHDIGKNIVAALFESAGFEVIDLGVDVSTERFLDIVREYKPDLLGLSALLTTTAPQQSAIIETLKKKGLSDKVKVIVGGGPITQDFADQIGADGYAANAVEGVEVAKRLLLRK